MIRPLGICVGVALMVAGATAQSLAPDGLVLRAFGDVNLGRKAGQRIFEGDTAFPFRDAGRLLTDADAMFVNLESPLTDQGGETRHPRDGYRFCGPRIGAATLVRGGIDVVSGANNHMYDYGRRGMLETLTSLDEVGIRVAGLEADVPGANGPVVLTVQGMRLGFVAYTEFVNMPGSWQGNIDVFDARKAKRDIAALRKRADLVVASYHGGTEYTEGPPAGTLRNLRSLADAGADVVIGHHPHVPQGVELRNGRVILYSLGNFVFYQPQRYWTQIGLALCLHVSTANGEPGVHGLHLIPFRAGLQPTPVLASSDLDSLEARFARTSPGLVRREGSSFILSIYDHTYF